MGRWGRTGSAAQTGQSGAEYRREGRAGQSSAGRAGRGIAAQNVKGRAGHSSAWGGRGRVAQGGQGGS